MHRNLLKGVGVAVIVTALAGTAIAADTTDRAAALERLEAARLAFDAARAELEAAQAEAARLVASTETASTDAGRAHAQPGADAEAAQEAVEPDSWFDGWEFKAFVGLNGASGNNENFSARASIDGERFTEKYETSLLLSYVYGTSEGETNTSRGEASIRNDWLLEDSRWRYFALGKYEYDEFQQWDHRISGSVGIGYELIDTEDTTLLIGRAGIGGSYETGGEGDDEFSPEALIGLELRHKLSDNTDLEASTTYYPNLDEWGEFRLVNTVGLEVVMDEETGLTLNTGIEHRHDSDPGQGFEPNDVEYYMGLGWTF